MNCLYCAMRFPDSPPNPVAKAHPCPYAIDVNDIDADDPDHWCQCCERCETECAANI